MQDLMRNVVDEGSVCRMEVCGSVSSYDYVECQDGGSPLKNKNNGIIYRGERKSKK